MQFWPNSVKLLQIPDSIALWNGQAVLSKNIERILFWPLIGFFSNFGYQPIFICCVQSKSGIFPIFVKKCNIEFEFNIHWGPKFSFQRFSTHIHKKLVIICLMTSNIPNLTMVNFGFICSQNYYMGFTMPTYDSNRCNDWWFTIYFRFLASPKKCSI